MKRKYLSHKRFAWPELRYEASVSSPWESKMIHMTNVWMHCRFVQSAVQLRIRSKQG